MDGFDLDGTQRLVKDNTRMVCNNAIIFMNYTWNIHHIWILFVYGLHGCNRLYLGSQKQIGNTYMAKREIKLTTARV